MRIRKIFFIFCFVLVAQSLSAQIQKALPGRPVPPRLVNDLAEVLQPAEETQLEQKLLAYNDSTSTQIAVVTVRTVVPYAIGDFANELGRAWGVGMQDKDNGIVILVAVDDREVFISTGYGVEGYLTDIATGRIIQNTMLPAFREGNYYAGIDGASDEILKYMTGAYEGTPYGSSGEAPNIVVIIIIVLIILVILSRINRKGGGTTFTRRGPTHWGGGGFGGFGGGGFGGGGFGGFGGGSFGGGGAGGRW